MTVTTSTVCPLCGTALSIDEHTIHKLYQLAEAHGVPFEVLNSILGPDKGLSLDEHATRKLYQLVDAYGLPPAAFRAIFGPHRDSPTPTITDSRERLMRDAATPGPIGSLVTDEPRIEWWLPSLAFLAYYQTTRLDARAALDEFALRRNELSYAVVEEQTDQIIGLSVQPWPLLDKRGRLRFPIDQDPDQFEVELSELEGFLAEHRRIWGEFDLLPEPLITRPVALGDTYAVLVTSEPIGPSVKLRSRGGRPRYLCGLADTNDIYEIVVPALDITWDAREAGKLAHYAAAAGVLPTDPEDPNAVAVQDANRRYLVAFVDNVDPRDVLPDDPSGSGPEPEEAP